MGAGLRDCGAHDFAGVSIHPHFHELIEAAAERHGPDRWPLEVSVFVVMLVGSKSTRGRASSKARLLVI
jgi:hypothetical protein